MNSLIRRKLGLDSHSTNLNLYIKKMLEENKRETQKDQNIC